MEGEIITFALLAAISLASALMVVGSREIFHAGLFLALNLITLGALFFLLVSEFLGAIQILIYGGAVIVLVLFAIILTRKENIEAIPLYSRFFRAVIMGVVVFAILFPVLSSPALLNLSRIRGIEATKGKLTYLIGYYLFTDYIIPFEIVGLALLAALLGAIAIIRLYKRGEEKRGEGA